MSGCGRLIQSTLVSTSSGLIGCPPKETIVEDYEMGTYASTWTAKCQGKTYYCSKGGGGAGAHCNEAPKDVKKASAKTQPERINAKSITPSEEKKSEPTAANQTDPSPSILMIATHNNTKVRKSPSSKATVMKTLRKGEEVQVVKQKDEWFLVELTGGETGWCHKSVLAQKENK